MENLVMRRALAAAAVGLVLAPSLGWADAATDAATAKELNKPPERRSGVVVGFALGGGIAGSSGYPNEASKIGDPSDYDGSDAMPGGGGTIFVMGALSDWLNFGFFYARATYRSSDWSSTGGGGGFRLEIFPLYRLFPKLQDLAAYGQFGIGSTTLTPRQGTEEASTGTESFLTAGVLYDFMLARVGHGHFALAPYVELDAISTLSNARYGPLVGARIAYYTGK